MSYYSECTACNTPFKTRTFKMDKEGYPICPECGGHGTIRLYRYEDDLSPEGEEEEED